MYNGAPFKYFSLEILENTFSSWMQITPKYHAFKSSLETDDSKGKPYILCVCAPVSHTQNSTMWPMDGQRLLTKLSVSWDTCCCFHLIFLVFACVTEQMVTCGWFGLPEQPSRWSLVASLFHIESSHSCQAGGSEPVSTWWRNWCHWTRVFWLWASLGA